ncbi:hypothetical protein ABT086_32225 [Streptomyces mirabilis]
MPPTGRSPAGYRLYGADALARLRGPPGRSAWPARRGR